MSSGTDKIVSSIMSEAQEKADAIIQDANAEVSAINADAEKTAEAEKNKILDNGKKQSDMRYQQIISEAKMNARRAELRAKEDVIEAAFEKATEDLRNIASGNYQYDDSLVESIKEAVDEVDDDDIILQLNEEDTNKLKSQVGSSGSFEIGEISFELGEPVDVLGGVIVRSRNSAHEVDRTFKSLEDISDTYSDELAEVIKNAVDEIGSDEVTLQLSKEDTNKFKSQLGSSDSFEIDGVSFQLGEPIDVIGGVVVKTRDGNREIDYTFKSLDDISSDYDDSLAEMIKDAVDEIESNDVVIYMNEKDTGKFKDQLGASDSFEIDGVSFQLGEPIDVIGGVIVKPRNAGSEVDNTFESLDAVSSAYDDELARMIKEAVDEIESDDVIIHLNEKDANKFKSQLGASDSFEIDGVSFQLGDSVDVIGGVIVRTKDDNREVNNTIESLDSVSSFDSIRYDNSLTKLIKEAVDEIKSDDVILHLNENDTNKFKNQLGSSDSFEIDGISFQIGEPVDTIGGVIVKTRNGDIEVNNTIESRLERFKSVLRSEVAKVLFK